MIDIIDAETVTPSDFTVTMKARRGCFGCCRKYPLEKAGSAQILAFIDSLMETKLFGVNMKFWDESVFEDLNEEFSDSQQINKLL